MKRLGFVVWLAILFGACSLGNNAKTPCKPPEGFTETDLEGTWWAGYHSFPRRSDTLIIRGDGTYKQIIFLETEDYEYESEWQPWRIEYLGDGVMYVHLTGMRLYAFNPNLIEKGVVGGGDAWFVDFCEGESVMPGGQQIFTGIQMPPGEGVLVVMRDPGILGRAPRGVFLLMLPVSDVSSWSYELQEP